jgi:hypothetical protein
MSFSIGNTGYLGLGSNGNIHYDDFWSYDPVSDAWTQEANFGGVPRGHGVGFSIGNVGYIGTGNEGGMLNDFWSFYDSTNVATPELPKDGAPELNWQILHDPMNQLYEIVLKTSLRGNYTLEISDVLGKTIHKESWDNVSGNISKQISNVSWKSGVYLFTIRNQKNSWSKKSALLR